MGISLRSPLRLGFYSFPRAQRQEHKIIIKAVACATAFLYFIKGEQEEKHGAVEN